MMQFLANTVPFLWQGLLITLLVSGLVVASSLLSGILFGIAIILCLRFMPEGPLATLARLGRLRRRTSEPASK